MQIEEIKELFENIGGNFVTDINIIQKKLESIKAYVFDWDGVFNDGSKGESKSSNYSEVDSMGTNILRLGHWLENSGTLPIVAIITGESNKMAHYIAERENFNHIYFSFKNKAMALQHLLKTFDLSANELAFFFDDILDFSIAQQCGLRFMISRDGSPLLHKYAIENNMADYISGQTGGQFAVREICELLLGLNKNYEKAVGVRTEFGKQYQEYLNQRSQVKLQKFVMKNNSISTYN